MWPRERWVTGGSQQRFAIPSPSGPVLAVPGPGQNDSSAGPLPTTPNELGGGIHLLRDGRTYLLTLIPVPDFAVQGLHGSVAPVLAMKP